MTEWTHLEKESLLNSLKSDLDTGLTQAEAEKRLAEYGCNELIEWGEINPWRILWEQLTAVTLLMWLSAKE